MLSQVSALLVGLPEKCVSAWRPELQPEQYVPHLVTTILSNRQPVDNSGKDEVPANGNRGGIASTSDASIAEVRFLKVLRLSYKNIPQSIFSQSQDPA